VRESDVLARLSGDEFALLLPEADRGQAEAVATSLVNLVRHHTVAIGRERAQVTASIGVAMMGDTSDADLVALADAAMYAAKDAGRDRVVVYDPEQEHPGAARHVGDAAGVRRALRDDRFVLHAQPIWSYAEATVEKYELLIRMRAEKDGGLIPPGDFLYAAERFGLVSEIDRWVVSEAVRLIAGQAALGRRVVLAVNLSGRSLGDDSVIEHIDHVLARGDIDPGCLVFELTETAAIGNIDAALSLTHRLRAHGCKLSLDDFGAGFSSFYYLRKLPFDYIKIDGEFVRGLRQSAADRLLIDAIVTMAHGLGKLTVAEFVADEETNELVKASGVDLAQGFYIGRPEAVDDVLAAAAAGRSALSSRR
jgi:EAL domain-containing protein (putative c-di-GMP-specific phosphodiesterase class I)